MAKFYQIFLLPLIITTFSNAETQNIKFEHFTVEQGLSNNTVSCILQDSQGFMWFGTEDGLNRYDGYRFKIFKHDPNDSTSLSDCKILSIYENKAGILWIGTKHGGLNKYNRETEAFSHYQSESSNSNSLDGNHVVSVSEDKSGLLWIGSRGSAINRFDPIAEKFTCFRPNAIYPNSLSSNNIRSVYVDSYNLLWIATEDGGINKLDLNISGNFNPQKAKFIHYQHDSNNPHSLSHNDARIIHEDASGTIWIGTGDGGLNRYDREKNRFIHYKNDPVEKQSLSHNFVKAIHKDRTGALWVGTWGGGLNQLINESGKFIHYKKETNNSYSLSNNVITSIYEDRSGVIWIGTFGGGLNKIVRARQKFSHYQDNTNDTNSLSHNVVQTIYEDRNDVLWIGTYDGLNKFDRKRNVWKRIYPNRTNTRNVNDNFILAVYEDQSGFMWIGTGNGLYEYDPLKEKLTQYQNSPSDTNSLSNNIVTSIYEDKSGLLWIGTRYGGLNMVDLRKGRKQDLKFIHFREKHDASNSLSGNGVLTIYEDRSGILWIGTGAGLNKFDRDKIKFDRYYNNYGRDSELANIILSICEDHPGIFWIGTGKGLFKFDRAKGAFQYVGLNTKVLGVLEDNQGNLWLSTDKSGIIRFNLKTKKWKKYGESDGLQAEKFYQNAYFKSKRTGEMFFGGINGFNAFYPEHIKDNSCMPQIAITDFKILNQPVVIDVNGKTPLKKSIVTANEIVLSHKDYIFSLEFAALDYTMPEKNRYAYMMEGLDKDWVYSGNRNYVTYSNLAPGRYIFRVKGSNNDGVWNETGTSIKIIVNPPWWRTNLAYAFYIFAVCMIIIGARQIEVRRVRLQNQLKMKQFEANKLQEIDRMKSRFFANISHEFRTPLTLILGPLEQFLTDKLTGDPKDQFKVSYQYGKRLLRLINQLLDLSKLEFGKMSLRSRSENIVQFLKGLVFSFASAAEREGIELKFENQEESIIAYIDRDKLEKIMTNLLSNALKFTPKGGCVTVSVSRKERIVEIKVNDTGCGIAPDQLEKIFDRFYQATEGNARGNQYSFNRKQQGTGIGLALTKELVDLHHGKIYVQSEPGKGTTFTAELPLGRAHLTGEEIITKQDTQVLSQTEVNQIDFEGEAESAVPVESEVTDPDKTSRPIVLVVEDNLDVRNYIRSYLDQTYQIMEAGDGAEALEKALKEIPDLIISDVMMPNMDGFEFCKKIKTDEILSHIPVILLTARASEGSKVEGLETGADDYLTKPFNIQELLVRVKNLIEQRRRLRERFRREINLQPGDIAITSIDEKFLQRVISVVEQNIADTNFDTQSMGWKVGLSRSQLHRKLLALTDQTPGEFIRFVRLKRAAQLLAGKAGNVTEIAYEVGYNNISHFAKRFREMFGVSPSEYIASKKS